MLPVAERLLLGSSTSLIIIIPPASLNMDVPRNPGVCVGEEWKWTLSIPGGFPFPMEAEAAPAPIPKQIFPVPEERILAPQAPAPHCWHLGQAVTPGPAGNPRPSRGSAAAPFCCLLGWRIIPAGSTLSSPAFGREEEPHAPSTSGNISLNLWKMGLRQACPRRALLDLVKHFGIVTERRSHGERFLGITAPVFVGTHTEPPGFHTPPSC